MIYRAASAAHRSDPFTSTPIMSDTLDLFVGRERELSLARNAMLNGGGIVFIEGGRGTGKSSLGNYLRFETAGRGMCISPSGEIPFDGDAGNQYFAAFSLWSAINAMRALSLGRGHRILNRDAIRMQKWAARHSSAMIQARLERESPDISERRCFRIERLREYARLAATRMGYRGGIVLQVVVGEGCVVEPEQIRQLHMPHLSWIFTGPQGSGRKLVGMFDDLIWLDLAPLPDSSLKQILVKRFKRFLPSGSDGLACLNSRIINNVYRLSGKDLGYTFHVCSELSCLIMAECGLINSITLEKAKKPIASICLQDINKDRLTPLAATVLRFLANKGPSTTGMIARRLGRKQSSVSRSLSELVRNDLAAYRSIGRRHIYAASSAARLLYSIKTGIL